VLHYSNWRAEVTLDITPHSNGSATVLHYSNWHGKVTVDVTPHPNGSAIVLITVTGMAKLP